jgi:hypothetical protein
MLNKIKPALIIGLVALITILQYSTDLSAHRHHILYQALFFIPIMLAGLLVWAAKRPGYVNRYNPPSLSLHLFPLERNRR